MTEGTPVNWRNGNMAIHDEIDALSLSNSWQRDVVHLLAEIGGLEELECQAEVCVFRSRKFVAGVGGNQGGGLQVDRKGPWPWKVKHASCFHAERAGESSPRAVARRRQMFQLGDSVRDLDGDPAVELIVIGRHKKGVVLVRPHGGGDRVCRHETRLVPYESSKLEER